jgi:hypothetical protein
MPEAKDYLRGVIIGVIVFVVCSLVVSEAVLPTIQNSGVPLLSPLIIGSIVGAGLLLFLVGIFIF